LAAAIKIFTGSVSNCQPRSFRRVELALKKFILPPKRVKRRIGRACACLERVLPATYAPVQDLLKKIEAAAGARLAVNGLPPVK